MTEYLENEEYPEEEEEVDEVEEVIPVQQVVSFPINRLRIHEVSRSIYRQRKNSKEVKNLAENMRRVGQLEPIVVNSKDFILSGVQRYYAALKLGMGELIAIVRDAQDPDTELDIIISYNKQRVKTPQQIVNETEAIFGLMGKSQGRRKDLLKSDKSNPYGRIGQDRYEFAIATLDLDISPSSLRRLISVSDFEKESKEQKKLGLLDKVFKNEITIFKASTLAKDYKKQKEEREKAKKKISKFKKRKDDKQPFRIINKSSNKMIEVESDSVQVVLSSPPYWNLRNYGLKNVGNTPLGLEKTHTEFIKALSKHLRDVRRVLKDTGSFFLNIGDTYRAGENFLIPTRLLLNLCDNEGWYYVNEIIWQKSTGIPQGKTKRLQPIYEKVFHLVKDPNKYYYEEFKNWKESNDITLMKMSGTRSAKSNVKGEGGYMLSKGYEKFKDFLNEQKVKDVIYGSTASFRQMELKRLDSTIDHVALMPLYMPVIPILTTSKVGDIVLDPFSGSGTTGKAALLLGRRYIGYELNEDYYELSYRDLSNTIESMGVSSTIKSDKSTLTKGTTIIKRGRGRTVVHRKGPGAKK